MQRIRTIIPKEGEGFFYNINDLLPLIPMEKEQWHKLFNEFTKFCASIREETGSMGLQKIFDRYLFFEEIKGANEVQQHIYCHREFFYFFFDRQTLKKINELIEGRPLGGEKPL